MYRLLTGPLKVRVLFDSRGQFLGITYVPHVAGVTTESVKDDKVICTGVLISPQPDQEGNNLRSMSGTRAISTTSRRELSLSSFFLQGKALKEIHTILTETLACFLPGWAEDL